MRLIQRKKTSTSSRNNFCSMVKFRRKRGNWWRGVIALAVLILYLRYTLKNSTSVLHGDQNVYTPWVKQRYLPPPPRTTVFYNVFTKNGNDEERVKAIVNEQFSFLDPKRHVVSITSIGHLLPNITNYNNTTNNERINIPLKKHYIKGNKGLTLHALWNFCKQPANNNHDTKVVYIHSKGSFHDNPDNTALRTFLTIGALSEDCDSLPSQCNVCSSRMSPMPHPHTSGNMWLARCDYIATLMDPIISENDERLLPFIQNGNACRGFGRFFFEHWVHSHPYVKPCDLYNSTSFTWAYKGVPKQTDWFDSSSPTAQKQLQMAPRFNFEDYIKRGKCKGSSTQAGSIEERIYNYKHLYPSLFANISASANTSASLAVLDKSWWGWSFFNLE